MKIANIIRGKLVLLFILLPLLLAGQSEDKLEEKLRTASNRAKIRLLGEYSRQLMETRPGKSFEYVRRSLQLAKESGAPGDMVAGLNYMGNWHLLSSDYQGAIKYYLEALNFEDRTPDKRKIANVLTNIGIVYWNMEDFDTALQYHTRALDMRNSVGYSKMEMGMTLNNLGLVAADKGDKRKGLEYYRRALKLYEDAGYKRGVAAALNNIAEAYSALRDYPRALKYYADSVPVYKEIGLQWGIANTAQNVGKVYTLMGQYEEAQASIDSSLEMAKRIGAKDVIHKSYSVLSMLCKERGEFLKALEYSQKATELKNALINEKNKKQIAWMNVKYETEKKDNEIRLLRKSKQMDRQLRTFLIIAVLMSIGIVLVLYSRFRTKQKSNQLLQMSEAKYKALYSQAGDAIFLMDKDIFIDCNERALEMFGAAREQIQGKTFADFSPAKQPDKKESGATAAQMIRNALNGQPQRFYWQNKKKRGTLFDTVVSMSAVTINRQQFIQAIVHDISNRKQLEDARVKNEKLEAFHLLAAGLAHDLNNLLTVLTGNLELVRMNVPDGSKAEIVLTRMEKVLQSTAELAEKFISLSDGGFSFKRLANIRGPIKDAVRSEIGSSKIRAVFQLPGDLWPVYCDIGQIKQVLRNLTHNAVEAMAGRGVLRVTAANVTLTGDELPPLQEGQYISISVKDNGEGISPENLSRIFDPYFTTRREYNRKGQGMGLSIADAAIKRHNGAITVSSSLAEGSTFTIYLPSSKKAK
jgi:PAS domain S-box-containing protein